VVEMDWRPRTRVAEVRVEFLSPAELKGEDGGRAYPGFGVLVSRAAERIATLARLYNGEQSDVDFLGLVTRARDVTEAEGEGRTVNRARVSARTGQRHRLGGTVGVARYRGEDLGEFLPWLESARWTGVARQTVWGKGELAISWEEKEGNR